MTRYSRDEAEQLIVDAQPVLAELLHLADALEQLHDRYGSEAALTHARLDRCLAWLTDRQVRLDGLDPATLAFPGRLVGAVAATDVWLSWRVGEDHIAWYYPTHGDVAQRRRLPPDVNV